MLPSHSVFEMISDTGSSSLNEVLVTQSVLCKVPVSRALCYSYKPNCVKYRPWPSLNTIDKDHSNYGK